MTFRLPPLHCIPERWGTWRIGGAEHAGPMGQGAQCDGGGMTSLEGADEQHEDGTVQDRCGGWGMEDASP